MRTAIFARKIRRALRARVPRRTLRRRIQIFSANLLQQRSAGAMLLPALVGFAAMVIIISGDVWKDGGSSILMFNAIGSAWSVFLIANAKSVLDRDNFARLDTLAVLPWTDRHGANGDAPMAGLVRRTCIDGSLNLVLLAHTLYLA